MHTKDEVKKTLNDADLIAIREKHMSRLEALYAGKKLERAFVLQGIGGQSQKSIHDDPERWVAEAQESLVASAERSRDPHVFRPLFLEHWFFGVHFVDAVLGATVVPTTQEGAGGWWTECLARPVGTLRPPDLERNPAWRKAQALALAMRDSSVRVPFFTPQVLSSPLNIAVNLYGEEFLVALVLDPEAARRDLRVITDTIKTLTRWFLATLPSSQYQPVCIGGRCQPTGFGQICGCTTQLLSAEQYREFIAPLDAEVFSCYPRGAGLIHLCGAHTQHLPVWRERKEFRAFQLNDRAAEDFPEYFKQLREDQIFYLNPTSTMTAEKALSISGGRRLVLVTDLPEAPLL